MFIADFILGHWLLFLMFPILMVPQIGKLHSITLFWLLPRYVLFDTLLLSVKNSDNVTAARFVLPSTPLSSQAEEKEGDSIRHSLLCAASCLY